MKKYLKTALAVSVVALIILASLLVFADGADAQISFSAKEIYKTQAPISKTPRTFEAWITVDKNASSERLGVIAGNYSANETAGINFEIRKNGNPYIWWNHNGSAVKTVNFESVDLRTGEKLHLAIVTTETAAYCYINGELKQEVSIALAEHADAKLANIAIGSDMRSGNAQYLKSTALHSVALFSDSRSADQIAADISGVAADQETLIGLYDLTVSGKERLKDHSSEKNHLMYTNYNDSSKNETYEEIIGSTEGMGFSAQDMFVVEKKLDAIPMTIEATVYFPKTVAASERGGVIIGNYGVATRAINFEVYSSGVPRFYWVDPDGTVHDYRFTSVNLYGDKWNHIAIVIDKAAGKIHCYLNGTLAQSLTLKTMSYKLPEYNFVVGGDQRSGNAQFFKGRIMNIALYSDARSAEEIAADTSAIDKSGLIAAWDFSDINEEELPDKIDDINEKYPLVLSRFWIESKEPVKDYAYSFAVVGDTQIIALNHPDKFAAIYDYIIDNKDEKKIKFVMGLGDITDKNTDAEWDLAIKNIKRLDGVIPYSLCRGNHDNSGKFNSIFKKTNVIKYKDLLDGYYNANKLESTWQELVVGDIKYLIMTLDYGASDAVLRWASEIIEAHPEHNVIITTHAYLFRDGTTLDQKDVCPPATTGGSNNGDHMWNKLISKHENITLVLSGHDPCDNIVMTQTKGEKGNTVTQMLIDPQGVDASSNGPTGMVAMLYFSEDGKKVQVEYYSTIQKKFFKSENQFEMEIDVVEAKAEPTPPVTTDTPTGTDTPVTTDAPTGTDTPANTTSAPEGTKAPVTTDAPTTQQGGAGGNNGGGGTLVIIVIAVAAAAAVTGAVFVVVKKKRK